MVSNCRTKLENTLYIYICVYSVIFYLLCLIVFCIVFLFTYTCKHTVNCHRNVYKKNIAVVSWYDVKLLRNLLARLQSLQQSKPENLPISSTKLQQWWIFGHLHFKNDTLLLDIGCALLVHIHHMGLSFFVENNASSVCMKLPCLKQGCNRVHLTYKKHMHIYIYICVYIYIYIV